jgi:ubiquinone/menaquinone biosynthesis C-methylase UbiE
VGAHGALTLKEHEKLWEHKSSDKKFLEQCASWWGNENAISRILLRLYVLKNKYSSVLDVGCGFCTDYDAFKRSAPHIEYTGVDICPTFVEQAHKRSIPAQLARAQELPFNDSSYDFVYARHVLEHVKDFKEALHEMVRVARHEVAIVFFVKPKETPSDRIQLVNVDECMIFQNQYSKSKIESFLLTLPKVKSFSWQEVKNKDECILHIVV